MVVMIQDITITFSFMKIVRKRSVQGSEYFNLQALIRARQDSLI